jgi:hypothetical protein
MAGWASFWRKCQKLNAGKATAFVLNWTNVQVARLANLLA